MSDAEQFSALIGDIYDAALDPDKWEGVIEDTCSFLKGTAGGLASFDLRSNKVYLNKIWGYDPKYLELFPYYSKLNPSLVPSFRAKVGQVVNLDDLMPRNEFEASLTYREWCKPQGFVDCVQVTLEKTATSIATVTIVRHERVGITDIEGRQRMQLLFPHFRRAVLIGKVIDLHKIEMAALADASDGLASAMILVDANGRIAHSNAAAQAMLMERRLLRNTGGKLNAVDPRADAALHDIVANAENGDAALGSRGIAVPLATGEGERYVAHVLPLTSGARRKAKVVYSAVVAVFVRKAELEAPHPIDALAQAFDLTPAELRVLMMIVQVGGVPQVAPILGISEPTVKTHLQHIFEKTGTSRQADLVKLFASYMSPLAGGPA